MKNNALRKFATRSRFHRFGVGISLCAFIAVTASAHKVVVHEQITRHAVLSAKASSTNYQRLLKVMSPTGSELYTFNGEGRSAMGWVIEGSAREDDEPGALANAGGNRSYNHFNDPLAGTGLSNFPPDEKLAPYGHNSFRWASVRNGDGINFRSRIPKVSNVNTRNEWSWQDAREYQRLALISSSSATRDENTAKMFRALGHVVHLLQDTTQPQHARDEQHLDKWFSAWKSPIEVYGGKNLQTLNYAHAVFDWRTAGFTQLRDFWDRDFYVWNRGIPTVRTPQALIDNENSNEPAKALGLAEFVSGNFLGDRHSYRELRPLLNPYHYPYPSLYEGTDWQQMRANPAAFKKTTGIANIGWGYRYIVAKTAQGRQVSHHAAVNYLMAVHPEVAADVPQGLYSATVDDPDVLKAYHDILIPEAIKYSAGILDYFSRGHFEFYYGWTGTQYRLRIYNRSGKSLYGGEFKLFRDDTTGNRSEVLNWENGELAEDGWVETAFPEPFSYPSEHTIVYKGTVGVQGATPFDPVDANIAIASRRFVLDPTSCTPPSYLQAGNYARLRIKDFDAQKFTTTCAECDVNLSLPAWDGTFPVRGDFYDPPAGDLSWFHEDYVAAEQAPTRRVNNHAMTSGYVYYRNAPNYESRSGCFYELHIGCYSSQSQNNRTIWRGRKIDGISPIGIYRVVPNEFGNSCIPSSPALEIEIEPAP